MRPMQVGSGKRGPSFDEGSLDQYLREISKYPLIPQEEEVNLAQRIRTGDGEALDKLNEALVGVKDTVAHLNTKLLTDENAVNVKETLGNLKITSANFAESTKKCA